MENITINEALVKEVAIALKELNEIMVFVGGATISLYTDDPAALEIRPTSDIDMTIKLSHNYADWVKLNVRLGELGFQPNTKGHALCNFIYNNINIDIMPSEDGIIGKANTWYKVGFDNLQSVKLDNIEISILTAPCFLATKFEAFNDRGNDYRTSHDFEDIIYVLDNRTTIIKEINQDNKLIRDYLNPTHMKSYLAISIHLYYKKDTQY